MAKLTLEEYNKLLLDGKIKIVNRTDPGKDTGWDAIILYALVEKGVDDSKEVFEALKKQDLILMPNVYKEGTDISLEQLRDGFAKLRELFIEPPAETKDAPKPTPEPKTEDKVSDGPYSRVSEAFDDKKEESDFERALKGEVDSSEEKEETEFDRAVKDGIDEAKEVKEESTFSVDADLDNKKDSVAYDRIRVTIDAGDDKPKPETPLTQEEIDLKILMDAYKEAILKKIEDIKNSKIDNAVKKQYLKNLNEIIANDDNLKTYVKNAINTGQISQKKLQETIDRGRNIIDNRNQQQKLTDNINRNEDTIKNTKGHIFLKGSLKRENKRMAKEIIKLSKSNIKLEAQQRKFFLKAVDRDKKRLMRVSELQLEYLEAEAEEAKFNEIRDNSKFIAKAMAGKKAKKAAKRKLKIETQILDLNGVVKITGARETVVDTRDYEAELEADEAIVKA